MTASIWWSKSKQSLLQIESGDVLNAPDIDIKIDMVASLKNAWIAFLLGLLPSLLIGVGLLFGYLFRQQPSTCWLESIPLLLGFLMGWGWGYVYLGHTLRAVAAFFLGYLVCFSLFFITLGGIGTIESEYEVYKSYYDFSEVFYRIVLVVAIAAGIGLAIDAARLARLHNQLVQEKKSQLAVLNS